MKRSLPSVTMVAIACTKVDETIFSMRKSMERLEFHEAILITHEDRDLSAYGIRVVQIERLDYKGYNEFVLYRLKDYITSPFALIVQHDGRVLHPESWTDEFLEYDYIGAPWPANTHFTPEGVEVRVGNGGFSLRSQKLLQAPSVLGIPFVEYNGFFNEDGYICSRHRAQLETYGINYAPPEVAGRFSREKKVPESDPRPFGFHNLDNVRPVRVALQRIKARLHLEKIGKIPGALRYKIRHHARLLRRELSALWNELSPGPQVRDYPDHIKVYDVFTFLNEFDLLELRMRILDPYVDYFVIIEATHTFSGQPKPLYFEQQRERFKKWEHKIIHHVTTDSPENPEELRARLENPSLSKEDRFIIEGALTSDNVGVDETGTRSSVWTREFFQKESIRKALVGLQDTDMCFVSDVDEIWNPEAKIDYRKNTVFKLKQKMYAYYLNNRSSEPWIGTTAFPYKYLHGKYLNHLRTERKNRYQYVAKGGWHFTNQGGADQIRLKLASYGHQEYNTEDIRRAIEERMRSNKDFIGRSFRFWKDNRGLPAYLREHWEDYKDHLL